MTKGEKYKEYMRTYNQSHKKENWERKKLYDATHKEKIRLIARACYQRNKTKRIAEVKEYQKNKRKSDPNFRIAFNLRCRLAQALKNEQRAGSAVSDLGCSIQELKTYLESKFTAGMSWDKRGQIHIDHIMPLSKFDLSDREQFKKASHYTNLQPLWAIDNLRKSNRLTVN